MISGFVRASAVALCVGACAPSSPPSGEAAIEARLAEADADAATSPASVVTASRFSRTTVTGDAAPLKDGIDLVPEISRDTDDLPTDEGERVSFDALEAPVAFDEAVAAALQNDVDVAVAMERISEAEAARINAIFGYLPRITAQGTFSRIFQNVLETDNAVFEAGTAEFNAVSLTGEVRQPLLNFSALLAIDAADVGKTAAEAEYVAVSQSSAFTSATVYLQALEAQTQIDGAERRMALLEEQIAAEERLIASGLSTETGKKLIAVEKGSINIELLEYRESLSLALAELGRLIGQPVRRVAAVTPPPALIDTAGKGPWEEYANAAFRANAELQTLRLETLRQRQQYYSQFLEDFAPTVDLFGRVEYEDREASRFGGGSVTRDFTLGVEANVPIFNATGEGYRNVEEESRLRQAILTEAGRRKALESEVRALVDRIEAQRRNIAEADSALAAASDLLDSAQRGTEFGVSSDLLTMRQDIQRAQAETWAARSRYAFLRSWVRLSFLTGERVTF